jgi:hypothetical protein
MVRVRSFLWLLALIAFALSSFGTVSAGHATASSEQGLADCAEHAPPPDPCPAKDSAKHAAGDCCPLMAGAFAVLPASPGGEIATAFDAVLSSRMPSLAGRLFTKDPPPPRV